MSEADPQKSAPHAWKDKHWRPYPPPKFFSGERPAWWPENEPWPPKRRPHFRGRFARRMGCFFVTFVFLGLFGLISLLSLIANSLGIGAYFGADSRTIPVVIGILVLGSLVFALSSRGLRRFTKPIGELLDASEHVAEGDFSVRVSENGPAEVRALAQAFNTMTSRLQTSDAQRRSFLADVTHEFKTPLAVLQANLEGIQDGVYPADEEHLKSLLEETNILARLVEDLRTLALSESGALQLKKEPTDLGILLHETVNAFHPQADQAGVTLHVQIAETPLLELDPFRLRQVVSNLISNALQYTPRSGQIQVVLDGADFAGRKFCRVAVTDTGRGIPPEDLPHVFERFYKSRDSGGTGLGLSIAKTLVELHGGTIEAMNNPGGGTRVIFRLPTNEN